MSGRQAGWTVLDTGAGSRQDVSLPAGLRVFEIGQYHVAGVDTDEFDVQRVKVFGSRAASVDELVRAPSRDYVARRPDLTPFTVLRRFD